jgi:Na+-translocating ferredoxin:NAD+ oxidoreductase RnfG subunit
MSNHNWLMIPALIVPAAIAAPAYAVQYQTLDQAQKALFPDAVQFVRMDVMITNEVRQQIEKASGVRVRNTLQQVWRAETGGKPLGWFVLDEVIGKHEFITYAVALLPDGVVKSIDILEYRETHGSEIKNEKWRAQFAGKKMGEAFKLDEDIKNISNGVKRIAATFQVAMK